MEKSVVSEHDGASRWLTMHDELLRGLTHTLSNRVGTIAAVSSLLELGGASSARALDTLRSETDRLEQLLMLIRQLPYREAHAAEPILAADVVNAAIALVAHHPAARDVRCEIVTEGDVPPAWSDPGALQLAIAVALISAHAHASGSADHVRVLLSSRDDVVRIAVSSAPSADVVADRTDAAHADDVRTIERVRDASAAAWLLRATEGRATASDLGLSIEVLSLAAARKRR